VENYGFVSWRNFCILLTDELTNEKAMLRNMAFLKVLITLSAEVFADQCRKNFYTCVTTTDSTNITDCFFIPKVYHVLLLSSSVRYS
jgi:hypothetical protein